MITCLEMRVNLPVARMVPIYQAALNILRKKVKVPGCKMVLKDGIRHWTRVENQMEMFLSSQFHTTTTPTTSQSSTESYHT